jgi:hypothetical protein
MFFGLIAFGVVVGVNEYYNPASRPIIFFDSYPDLDLRQLVWWARALEVWLGGLFWWAIGRGLLYALAGR